jgi:hypothetical protein
MDTPDDGSRCAAILSQRSILPPAALVSRMGEMHIPPRSGAPIALIPILPQSYSTSPWPWLDDTTEPPPATNRVRIAFNATADTGSTARERLVQHQQPGRVQ